MASGYPLVVPEEYTGGWIGKRVSTLHYDVRIRRDNARSPATT